MEKIGAQRERIGAPKPVARREAVIATLCGVNLTVVPWACAGSGLGVQVFAFVTAALAFAFLFLPVGYDERRSATARESLAALARCAPFWCGLALMILFVTQGLNPAYTVMFDRGDWLLMPETPVPGLPAGVDAPFVRTGAPGGMNAWRTALIVAPVWLTFCALWCGVRGRRVTLRLAAAVAFSGGALAVAALGLRATGRGMYPESVPAGASPFGPFSYQNQAGAFFALSAAVAFSAALAYWVGVARSGGRGGAHQPVFLLALLAAVAAPASFSFGALIAVSLLIPAVVAAGVVCRIRLASALGDVSFLPSVQTVAVIALVSAAIGAAACLGDFRGVAEKLQHKLTLAQRAALDDRAPIRAATLRMYADTSAVWGYGAGAYRWVSPTYFAQDPCFCNAAGVLDRRAGHAHGDWLQMLAEWGAAGLALVAGALGWALYRVRRVFAAASAVAWPAFAGLVILGGHAWVDCLVFNPAVALAAGFCVCFVRTLIHVADVG